jgi:hypothetical protein
MKKKMLLVVLMVLSMATMASANLQLSINGDKTAAPITLQPSGTASFGIWTDAALAATYTDYFVLTATIGKGSFDYTTGAPVFPTEDGLSVEHTMDAITFASPLLDGMGENGVGGGLAFFQLPGVEAGTQLFEGMVFHCDGPISCTIKLYQTDFSTLTLVDTVVIQQIPEPMTLGLLGIGGLFLRRRK